MHPESHLMSPWLCLRSSRRRNCRAASFSSRRLLRRSSASSAPTRSAACINAALDVMQLRQRSRTPS